MDGGADEGAGIRAASDFCELMRVVVEVAGGDACRGLATPVAVDVVAVRLGGAVAGAGQAVEVVVQVAPGLRRAADVLGLPASAALDVEAVEVAGENRGVEQVLFLLESAVFEPALGGALAAVETGLDEAAACVVGDVLLGLTPVFSKIHCSNSKLPRISLPRLTSKLEFIRIT
ncbi:MAG: hypothetical protein ACOH1Q_12610 [Thiobacillus sp.]